MLAPQGWRAQAKQPTQEQVEDYGTTTEIQVPIHTHHNYVQDVKMAAKQVTHRSETPRTPVIVAQEALQPCWVSFQCYAHYNGAPEPTG